MATQGDTPAASLVGAIGVFAVPDVLQLIASGGHGGEILVVANGIDGRLWLADGALTGAAVRGTSTLAQAVFELSLLEDGWFYFTAGRAAPEPAVPVAVEDVLDVVLPQVVEWRDLLHRVPLDAVVTLSPAPPQAQVQLSAVEWQVLAAVSGRATRVIDVVAATGRDQVETVRTLRDMADAGLVVVSGGTAPGRAPAPAAAQAAPATGQSAPVAGPAAPPAAPLPPPPVSATGGHPVDGTPAPAAAESTLVPMVMAGTGPRPQPAVRAVASDPPLPPIPPPPTDTDADGPAGASDGHPAADLDRAGAAGS